MKTSEALSWLLDYPDPEVGKMTEAMINDVVAKVNDTKALQEETEEIIAQTKLDQAYVNFSVEATRQEMAVLEEKLRGY